MKIELLRYQTVELDEPLFLNVGWDGDLYDGYDSRICSRDQLPKEKIEEIADRMIARWIEWKEGQS